jgi:hypothetical protein
MMHSFALFHHASGEHTVISDDSAFSGFFFLACPMLIIT